MSPFYGVTSSRFEGNSSENFNDVQKSYGMWMVPPDVGTTVIVIFPQGAGFGYWIGCVPDIYQNHMVPGLAASSDLAITSEQEKRYGIGYGVSSLPVAEFNKKVNKGTNQNISRLAKPVHPFADVLLKQGLLADSIRGVTSSSARREIPSTVFGISTPGPVDTSDGAPKGKLGFDNLDNDSKLNATGLFPISRLGGSTFVMDDGDQNGDNELVRIRTRTGHQILLHNKADLIYIGNSTGTVWIELTSAGKIDVYAEDSVSIHTKGDFNLRADRDFNLEAGRNFNINSADGDFNLNVSGDTNIITDTAQIQTTGDFNLSSKDSIVFLADTDFSSLSKGQSIHSSEGKFSISGAAISVGAQGRLSISGSTLDANAGRIDLNSPGTELPPSIAFTPAVPTPLNLFSNPQNDGAGEWSYGKFYAGDSIISIMQRIPTHEPWAQHENINPSRFSLANTDSTIIGTQRAANGAVIQGSPSANDPFPVKNGPSGDRGTVQSLPVKWTTDQPFLNKIKAVAAALNFNPLDLIGIMYFESAASMDPAKKNNLGYTGLIQFGKPAADSLRTSTELLARLTRVGQMDYVEKYFNLWGWPSSKVPSPTIANIYLTVLLPAFRFAAPDSIICSATDPKTSAYYRANPAFDPYPKKGYFTPNMVANVIVAQRRAALQCLANSNVGVDLIVPLN
jgi:hypothetical protein